MRVITVGKSSVSGDDTRATQPSLCLLKAEHGVPMGELTGQMDKSRWESWNYREGT